MSIAEDDRNLVSTPAYVAFARQEMEAGRGQWFAGEGLQGSTRWFHDGLLGWYMHKDKPDVLKRATFRPDRILRPGSGYVRIDPPIDRWAAGLRMEEGF